MHVPHVHDAPLRDVSLLHNASRLQDDVPKILLNDELLFCDALRVPLTYKSILRLKVIPQI